MRTRLVFLYDIVVVLGFGVYLGMTVWHLPETLRHRLVTASLHLLAQLTGMVG